MQGSASVLSADGGAGDDKLEIVGAAVGQATLAGGAGDDVYSFFGNPTGAFTVDEIDTGLSDASRDGLDFSGLTSGGVTIDLSDTRAQALAPDFTLTLTDPLGIENVIGTAHSDTILGNDRPNDLSGSALPDSRAGSTTTSTFDYQAGTRTQWVFLDFVTDTDPSEHDYSQDERDAIEQRIEADYLGPDPAHPWFNVRFTQDVQDIPADLRDSGQFATEFFNQTPSFNRPGGEASEVDFGNVNLGGSTVIQVNGLLGGVDQPDATSDNFIRLSSKIAAHELGHLMGIRHSDAFGPVGLGLHSPPGSDEFKPATNTAEAAFETFDHLISSPATVGSDRFNDIRDLSFGPREAIKLAFADHGVIEAEPDALHDSFDSAVYLPLDPLAVPDTAATGVEAGTIWQVGASAVRGITANRSVHRPDRR